MNSLVHLLPCFFLFAVDGRASKLNKYLVDKDKITISGFSSGGYFAVQFHVAFSSTIKGAGIMAGGPFWCAKDDLLVALDACTKEPSKISVNELVAITYTTASTLTIDDPSNLKHSRIYLFSGAKDSVVVPGVMEKLAQYYTSFVTEGSLVSRFDIPAIHGMVTDDYGSSCDSFKSPYIINCNYSTAYYLLQQIYQDIRRPNKTSAKIENFLEFDQSEFFSDFPGTVSMDTTGFLYVPTNCQNNERVCRLHVAFHGCLQGRIYISDTFAIHAGYNAVAEENDIIILYPQAKNSTLNPQGCWDWWGYTSSAYATQVGPQMAGVKLMLDRAADLQDNNKLEMNDRETCIKPLCNDSD